MIKSSITFKEHTLPQLMQHESGIIILVTSIEVDTNEDSEQEWVSGIILTNGINQKSLIGKQIITEYLLSNCKIFTGSVTLSNS